MIGHFSAVWKPPLHLFRYSMRAILVLTTVACLLLVLATKLWPPENPTDGPVVILGPITEGSEILVLDPPTDDEVLRALNQHLEDGSKLLTDGRQSIRIVREKTAEYVDPARVYPLIGPARQHHAVYRYMIYSGFGPFDRHSIEVHHTHLHMVGDSEAERFTAKETTQAR